jgi:hypothetical protein
MLRVPATDGYAWPERSQNHPELPWSLQAARWTSAEPQPETARVKRSFADHSPSTAVSEGSAQATVKEPEPDSEHAGADALT